MPKRSYSMETRATPRRKRASESCAPRCGCTPTRARSTRRSPRSRSARRSRRRPSTTTSRTSARCSARAPAMSRRARPRSTKARSAADATPRSGCAASRAPSMRASSSTHRGCASATTRPRSVPELAAIFAAGDDEVRRLSAVALAPEREPAAGLRRRRVRAARLPRVEGADARAVDGGGRAPRRRRARRPRSAPHPTQPASKGPAMTPDTNTSVDEIADGIYRISTPVPASVVPGGFTFNQYLIARRASRCCSTPGPRMLFAAGARGDRARAAGRDAALHLVLARRGRRVRGAQPVPRRSRRAPQPLCGQVAALVSIGDLADRAPHALADGETLSLGRHVVRWHRRAARAARLGMRLPRRRRRRARSSAAISSPSSASAIRR